MLRPTKAQRTELERILEDCRTLYNAALQEKRDAYQKQGVSLSCSMQQSELPELKELCPAFGLIYAQVLQDVLKRLHRAFEGFFRRVKAGQKPGYPRFKSKNRYDSFTFPQIGRKGTLQGCGVDRTERGRLKVHGIAGEIKVVWHRAMAGRPKTAQFKREGDRWYVVFTCDQVPLEEREKTGQVCGMDVGLESFAVLDDKTEIENPRFFRKAQREIKLAARQVHKKRHKRSGRRRKAVARLATVHRRVANRRRDHHHKTARGIVRKYDGIGIEDLNIAGMARGFLSKSVLDAGWSQFLGILSSKAEGAGCEVAKVNAAGSSQECAVCAATVPKKLSERMHRCPCGFVTTRDHNSALIMRIRAFGTGLGRSLRRGASGGVRGNVSSHASCDPRSPSL